MSLLPLYRDPFFPLAYPYYAPTESLLDEMEASIRRQRSLMRSANSLTEQPSQTKGNVEIHHPLVSSQGGQIVPLGKFPSWPSIFGEKGCSALSVNTAEDPSRYVITASSCILDGQTTENRPWDHFSVNADKHHLTITFKAGREEHQGDDGKATDSAEKNKWKSTSTQSIIMSKRVELPTNCDVHSLEANWDAAINGLKITMKKQTA